MNQNTLLKKRSDHLIKISPLCGEITEILTNQDNPKIDLAMAQNIGPTLAHYHLGFEEIYLVMDGWITIALYEPNSGAMSEHVLKANELVVIAPNTHHKVVSASSKNRLIVICLPGFDAHDEHVSNVF